MNKFKKQKVLNNKFQIIQEKTLKKWENKLILVMVNIIIIQQRYEQIKIK